MNPEKPVPDAEKARMALLARLDQLCRKPVKPPKSLQPTPEAGKSRIRRFQKKRRLLLKKAESRAL
jgi:hypothetical protein